MKTTTKVVSIVVACIAAVTAAVFAAAPQAPKREPSVLTIKSNGKPVAVLTLDVLDDGPLEIRATRGSTFRSGGKSMFSGDVTIRLRQAGDQAAFEIKADEIEVETKSPIIK